MGVTGFHFRNRIITDNWIHQLDDIAEIKIRFYDEDGYTISNEYVYDTETFKTFLPEKEKYSKYGLSYINCNHDTLKNIPEIEICTENHQTVGKESFFIAYQYKHNNLAIKSTIVSSYQVNDNGLTYIHYDGTVKPGSNGAPLFSKSTGKLIGIIANKELGIVNTFQDLVRNADANLERLESIRDRLVVDDIDIVQVMMACQSQLKFMVREFYGNFAAKLGYALDVEHLKEMFETDDELDFE